MAKTVTIGCRLPHGMMLQHPMDKTKKVILAGLNKCAIIGSTFMTTDVDADFWEHWKLAYGDLQPFKSNAIFEASGVREAGDKAKELVKEKTGFERANPLEFNVKPADFKD